MLFVFEKMKKRKEKKKRTNMIMIESDQHERYSIIGHSIHLVLGEGFE